MATDLATVAIAIDSSGAKTGADESVKAAERIKTSFGQLSPIQAKLVADYERLRQQMHKGALGHDEYIQKQNALLLALQKSGQAVNQAASFTTTSGAAAVNASVNWSKLRAPLQAAILGFSGIPGPVGRVVGTLGLLGGGGALAVGVVAGVAAITAGFNLLTKAAREAKERTDELTKSLLAAYREARGLTALQQEADLLKQVGDLSARAARELRPQVIPSFEGKERAITLPGAVSAATKRDLEEARQVLFRFYEERAEKFRESEAKIAAERERRDKEALAAAQRVAAEKARLHAAELAALKLIADATGDPVLKAYAAQITLLDQLVATASKLPPLFAEQLVGAIAAATTEVGRLAEVLETRLARAEKAIGVLTPKVRVPGLSGFRDIPGVRVGQVESVEATIAARREEIVASEQARQSAINYAVALGVVSYSTGTVLSAMSQMAAAIQRFGVSSKEAVVAIAQAIGQLANAVITGKSTGASVARGALAGAAAGAATGNPYVAAAGFVLGGIAGLLGSNKAKREAEKQRRAEQATLQERFTEFARQGAQAGRSPTQRALEDLRKQFEDLQKAARALRLSTSKLEQDYYKQVRAILALFEAEQAQFKQEVEIRRASLEGRTEEAAALALQLQQERERQDLIKQGYDEAAQAALGYVHALEQERAAREAQIEALRKVGEQEGIRGDLLAREAALRGDAADAEILRLRFGAAAQGREAQGLFLGGTIDQATLDRFLAVIEGELAKALKDLENQARATADALISMNRRFGEDLEVRRLAALGQGEDAERLARALGQERELAEALAAGIDAANLARLQEVQVLENQAVATEKLRHQSEALLQVQEQAARTMEDLRVRELRATGRGGAADELALLTRQQAELRDASGLGGGVLTEIRRVQGLERAFADAERQRQQQELFDRAASQNFGITDPFPASATSFNAAVGITESQANRLAGLMQTQVTYQANLPAMREALRELVQLARIGAGLTGSTLDIDAIDAALARRSGSADRASGLAPSNV